MHKRNENVSVGFTKERKGLSTEKRIKGFGKDIVDIHQNYTSSKPLKNS